MKNICICIIYLLLTLTGTTLIKMGGQSQTYNIHISPFLSFSPMTIAGIFFYGLSFLIYTFLISKMQISITMPVISATYSCALVVIGIILFKEVVNSGQLIGLGIIAIGILILGIWSH